MEKSGKISKIVTIFAYVLLMSFVAFFLYSVGNIYKEETSLYSEKSSSYDEPSDAEEVSSNTEEVSSNTEEETNAVADKIDFPQKSDSSVLILDFSDLIDNDELNTNFKDLKRQKDKNTFTFNCVEYSEEYSSCNKISVNINNNVNIDDIEQVYKVYIWKDYCIIYYYDIEIIYWFDIYKKSDKVYSSSNRVKDYYYLDKGLDEALCVSPVIVNNKLHFVEVNESDQYKIKKIAKFKYNTIDLSSSKYEIKTEKEFNGYFEMK